jgi:hypothetical protein
MSRPIALGKGHRVEENEKKITSTIPISTLGRDNADFFG